MGGEFIAAVWYAQPSRLLVGEDRHSHSVAYEIIDIQHLKKNPHAIPIDTKKKKKPQKPKSETKFSWVFEFEHKIQKKSNLRCGTMIF